ncbi:hypothetical protein [Rubrolithibacter danxiaensis]|uniref:hypothetical protein n=1 Tax=Rubrolithibacter danxiaensis TaxID=3390805 RepID=UPI003BF7BC20
METHLIPFSGTKLCKAKQVKKNIYQITMDNVFIGYIRKEQSGWMLEEYSKEELTAENVQLIGDQIDQLDWRLTQY